jgi:hypothetical protein
MRRRITALAAAFLLATISVGCSGITRRAPTEEQAAEYKKQAEPITNALEAYYAEHGTYPPSIEEIGMQHFNTPYGSSRYEVFKDGQMCEFVIGDPKTAQDFNLHWTGLGKDSPKYPQKWTWVVYPKK